MVLQRILYELRHPDEVNASSGMWAFGDMMMFALTFCTLMVPTFFALRLIARAEEFYTRYSKFVVGMAVTAPAAVLLIVVLRGSGFVGETCLWRLFLSPFAIIAIGASRVVAQFKASKRLLSYALLTETFTFATAVILLVTEGRHLH